jgi:hypothetical protein
MSETVAMPAHGDGQAIAHKGHLERRPADTAAEHSARHFVLAVRPVDRAIVAQLRQPLGRSTGKSAHLRQTSTNGGHKE